MEKQTTENIDFNELIQAQNQELKRLCWTNKQTQKYIINKYRKIHRQFLTEEQLMDFLNYLKSLP
jgi:hypothetical protein